MQAYLGKNEVTGANTCEKQPPEANAIVTSGCALHVRRHSPLYTTDR